MEGVISWQQLLDIGNNASDGNLRSRLANIAINQVVMWVVMVVVMVWVVMVVMVVMWVVMIRAVFPTVVTIFFNG